MYLGRAQLPCLRTAESEARLPCASPITQSNGDVVSPFGLKHLACTLLERLTGAIEHIKPVLLIGETGRGKAPSSQKLAHPCFRRLRIINLSQQSDSIDLIGDFKAVDTRFLVRPDTWNTTIQLTYCSLHTLFDRILTIYVRVRQDLESSSAFTGSRTISPRLFDCILTIYVRVRQDLEFSSAFTGSRNISPRDLLKFDLLLNLSNLIPCRFDCFIACAPNPSRLLQLASKIAGELNLTAEKVLFIPIGYRRSSDVSRTLQLVK
ncbi:LOW QUALITY PROTEIN: hypothetical protein T265_12602 [Opisthorchis viverrini]|uniref:Uncharacterized protein n=1 Tax=Opisthorchis viverrini TaxID=6198 RepID=A0A075A5I5_OPIVI|nr:LOW QUALITY PROTEIN: hypothetical protein T265_12602 [Opisthorchis viverrini]KER33567.1 LOW QUALITY PROTEIN: hypothetical protein T265_12602 [Opisthorchis viverrini]